MANFKTLTSKACGTNDKLNSILTEIDSFQDNLLTNLKSEVDASGLLSSVEGNVSALLSKAKSLMPEIPSIPDLGLQDELKAIKDLQSNLGASSQEAIAKIASLKSSFPDFDVDTLLTLDVCDAPNITAPPISSIISANQTDEKTQTINADNVTLADKETDTEEDYSKPTLGIAASIHNGTLDKAKALTAALIVRNADGTVDEQKRARDRQRMRNNGKVDYVKEIVTEYTEDEINTFIKLDAANFPKLEEFEKNPVADKTLYEKYLKTHTIYRSDYNYTESNPEIEPFELKDWYAELGRAVPT